MKQTLSVSPVKPLNDWADHPFIVIWEVTRACALACRHCRASAIPHRNPNELSTEEGFALIEDVKAAGTPLLVLTGGDPALRQDLPELVRHAADLGLRVALSPSATPRLTRRLVHRLADAGAAAVSLSLDGATAAAHDAFRGVERTFARTLHIAEWVRETGMSLQVNTTVNRVNLDQLEEIKDVVQGMGVSVWSLFFLVPTGRASTADMLTAAEHEDVYGWIWEIMPQLDFGIKVTEGQPFRRYALMDVERRNRQEGGTAPPPRHLLTSINDGRGFCFVSHVGDVCPSGFLELAGGNVHERPLSEIYRTAPLFRSLRDPDQLKGKCSHCRFRAVCGGSRARAYHLTGDILAADPTCAYVPQRDVVGEQAV